MARKKARKPEDENEPKPPPSYGKNCKAIGCSNHAGLGIKKFFVKFPSKKSKPAKWKMWVQAMKRKNADGSPWVPESEWSYVCKAHFVTGE